MASLPPKIDQRTYEEIVEQTKNLAQHFTNWRPAQGDTKDAGEALIRIFARMVKLASDRVNQVPEKNFLAFLDLIGGQLEPPLPAKVPLTFYLAEGSPTDGLVPAYTRVSAPPAEGSDEEILFESDRELVVTTAQLQAVFVREPSRDKYSERTLEATGQKDEAFLAFSGDRAIEHSLYITCPEIFALPELKNFNLIITDTKNQFQNLNLNWSYWDGLQWQLLTNSLEPVNNQFLFPNLPILNDSEIDGKTAKWLRAKLTNIDFNILVNLPQITNIQGSINIAQSNLIPEVCLFNNTPLDLSKDFYPFGEQPEINDTFYIALHDTFIKPNTSISLDLISKLVSPSSDLTITWEIVDGEEWKETDVEVLEHTETEEKSSDLSPNFIFTENEKIIKLTYKLSFTDKLSPSTVNGETRYWIRARITKGHYGKPSQERKYISYNSVAIIKTIARSDSDTTITIAGNAADFFSDGDVIYLETTNNNTTIIDLNNEYEIRISDEGDLKIAEKVGDGLGAVGTKIFKKLSISETIPPTYDPPLVKSLKLAYDFTLPEDAIYFADNDFKYSHPDNFTTELKEEANLGDELLTLKKVEGLTVGAFLTINTENYQIETINPQTNQVILTSVVSQKYAKNTLVSQYFKPFTPTIDKEPALYLGFDKSFDNKTVTLYAQVEPPLPDELSIDITTETFLTEAADVGQTIVELSDVTGWQSSDTIEIQNPSNKKKYDSYIISDINNNQITLNEPLEQNYSQNTLVIYPKQPELVWQYSSPLGWQPLGVKDETQAFSKKGLIQFIAPADFSTRDTFGKQLYWLRVLWQGGNFRVKPRLRRLLTNTIWAVQATTLTEEVLGSSNSEPNQVFVANNTPILLEQQLEVEEGQIPEELASNRVKIIRDDLGEIESVWVLWQEVADFYDSGASDRHYILDRQTGAIRFGDGQTGMIPPRGRNNIRLSFYRTGGGELGNVGDETISQLNTTIPYIDRVINHEAAAGGANQENLERLKQRVPKQLRHRDRAVTIDDLADLAYEASTDVARVKVVSPDLLTANFSPFNENFWLDTTNLKISFNDILESESWKNMSDEERANNETILREINRRAGQVKLIVLPHSQARQPVPSLALLEQVEIYIRDRCQPTMDLVVTAPKWQAVTVTVTITPVSFDQADILRNTVKQSLEDYLHPLTGGTGEGWQFGRYPEKSDFYAIIQSISGVDHVNFLEVEKASLTADTVIYSGNHVVYLSQ